MNGSLPARPASAASSGAGDRKRVTLVEGADSPPNKRARRDDDMPGIKVEQQADEHEHDDVPEEDRKLEAFRKEAIYREMLAYKRQLSRATAEAASLRSQRTAYEVRVSRVELAWQALVSEAELILPSTSSSAPASSERAASPLLTSAELGDDDELDELLRHRSAATKALLERLQSLHPTSSTASPDLEAQCRTLLLESQHSREALRLLRAEHAATLSSLEQAHQALVRAERKFDRYQSQTVAALEGRLAPASKQDAGKQGSATPQNAAAGAQSPAGRSPLPSNGVKRQGSSAGDTGGGEPPGLVGLPDEAARAEVDELRATALRRSEELDDMRRERATLKLEIDTLRGKLVNIPEDEIAESALFRAMQQHVQYLAGEYATLKGDADRAMKEADELREGMEAYRESAVRDASEQATELRTRVAAQESDLSRLRTMRDDSRAEVAELRAKESDKAHALDELRTLANARKARLRAYESELRRVRIGRAAEKGDAEGVELRVREAEAKAEREAAAGDDDEMEEGEVEVGEDDVVADLSARLKKAEGLLLALGEQLKDYAAQTGGMSAPSAQQLIDSETRARADLAEAQQRIVRLEAILGPGGRGDVRELAERLEEKQRELKKAEAQVKGSEAATNMLYGEIDRLSTAWAALDEQNSSKVFNLAALEEKIQRLNAEKAKSDNRYFSTMRQKDSLVSENSVLNKLAEKQQQKIEVAADAQRAISQQLTQAEREISAHQGNVRAWQEQNADLKRKNVELQLRNDAVAAQVSELTNQLAHRVTEYEHSAAARLEAEEKAAKLEQQLQQAQAKATAAASTTVGASDPSEVRELKKYNADLMRMLRCSTCNVRFKSVIINRCGHTFCKECVDTRLANRNRKCMSCAAQFGRDDVSPVYL
ncbi:hypothetical protein Rhopal_004035-T1 [Rhodotorula paludigena]|uniref:E3 ubiquitin protein ligase n=1 Tax=Rhodotorula paludigena TaxID=86838 RepID=A0AAV5GEN5_9BASI|nr:hypothetical protein Rhopal_004035-T1 [Rhodotorula paludigena]